MDFVDTGEPDPPPDVADELSAGAEALQGTRWGSAMREAAAELAAMRKDAKAAEAEMEASHSALQAFAAEDIDVPACVQEALDHLNAALERVRRFASA